jgi:Flp pilus assembly protein TadD
MRPVNCARSPMIATNAPGATAGWRVLAVAAILILAALGAYWNSFNVPFLLDDSLAIDNNPSIRHLGRIGDVLSPPTTAPTAARPLLNLSLALNFAGDDVSVRGYHVVNWLIHVCAGLALLGIVRRTLLLPGLRPRYGEAALPLAACVALLWTLHPLQTESVTYISQRAESLMGLFYLLTLYCFIRAVPSVAGVGRGRRTPPHQASILSAGFGDPALQQSATVGSNQWLWLSLAACLCGMATKQVMVTAPVLVLLYDRAFVSGSFRSALTKRRWYYVGLAVAWGLLGFLMHHSPLPKNVGFQADVSWPAYALTELRVVTDYLKLAFWPHPLVFDYGAEILATDLLAVAPDALVMAAMVGVLAIAWRRSPMVAFLGGWFFLILAPTSTVVPIAEQPMAESRMYLPLAAVVVLVTVGSYALGRRSAFIVLGLVAVGLGALTVRRNHDYRSEVSLWEDTLAKHPYTSRGHCQLGMALVKIPGQLPAAIAHYEEALRIKPAFAEAQNNLAVALVKTPGRMPEAIAHYQEALRLDPDRVETRNNLAMVLGQMPGGMPDAIAHYEEALRLHPDAAQVHYDYAVTLAKMPGRLSDAIAHYEAAARLKPDFIEARNSLAATYAETGRLEAAIEQLEIAARLNPASPSIRDNLEKLKAMRKQ